MQRLAHKGKLLGARRRHQTLLFRAFVTTDLRPDHPAEQTVYKVETEKEKEEWSEQRDVEF